MFLPFDNDFEQKEAKNDGEQDFQVQDGGKFSLMFT